MITPHGRRLVLRGHALRLPTTRPDLAPSRDPARCARASASSSQPGAPALAAVDGSPATDWQPVRLPATLTVPLRPGTRLGRAELVWGRQWPPAPAPNVPPPPGPVKTLRPASYVVQVSTGHRRWRTVARVRGGGGRVTDVLRFWLVAARWVRVRVRGTAVPKALPELDELTR